MPELPEVETIRLQLDQKIKGLRITGVEVLNKKSFIGDVGEIRGVRVIGVRRRGKITIIELEGEVCLAIHLKLTGQLIYRESQKSKVKSQNFNSKFKIDEKESPFSVDQLPSKYTRVIIYFDNEGRLYFNDLRMFGWVKIITQNSKVKTPARLASPACKRLASPLAEQSEAARAMSGRQREAGRQNQNLKLKTFLDEIPELEKLGPEANDPEIFSLDYFRKLLAKSKKPIKLVLMDQEKLAGVGNIYANEALFSAGTMPTRKANELNEEDIKILRDSILKILKEAVRHKGTSDRDEAYRQISGEKGTHQNYLRVYGRVGQKCLRCGGTIKRIALGGRGTFYCSNCQR